MEQLIANLTPNGLKIRIEEALKKDSSLVTESGELNYTKIRDMAQKLDPHLAELLMADESCVTAFFKKIGKSKNYIFDSKRFVEFLDFNTSNNSYSKFLGKKIGLYYGDELLTDRSEVVLNFPYKDCVLEGGQKTEDGEDVVFTKDSKTGEIKENTEKRHEIFYNEILAADEITSLFEPKAFCNVKRYEMPKQVRHDSHSDTASHSIKARHSELVSESPCRTFHRDKDGMITDNLIIKGNNLLALHSLYKEFAGRVKLIYIDPPYNTGSDSFVYNDNYNHSTWLTFMKNRLEIARELLREDGCIFVHCDDNEQAYIKVLMDEIFQRQNFVSTIAYQGLDTIKNDAKYFSKNHEFILCYAFNIELLKIKGIKRTEEQNKVYKNPDNDERGPYLLTPLHAKSGTETGIYKYKFKNGIVWTPPKGTYPRFSQETLKSLEDDNRIYFGKNDDGIPQKKTFLKEVSEFVKLTTFWSYEFAGSTRQSKSEIKKLDLAELFNTPKSEKLMSIIIDAVTDIGDLVLDYHLGSGTTAAVAHKMHRQYIGVEQMDYIETISVERLKKVIEGEQGGISKSVGWNPQNAEDAGSFVYLELAAFNETALKEISACKNYEELCALFKPLCQKYFLYYNVHIKDFGEKIITDESFKTLPLKKQKEMFCRMLDLNEFYINKSEMEDSQFGLSENDIAATKDFYGEK